MQKKMKFGITVLAPLFLLVFSAHAQTKEDRFIGKWLSKDKITLEVYKTGNTLSIKQIESPKPKEKKNNGKTVAKGISETSQGEFKGISVDLNDNKEYQSNWILSNDAKKITFKLKWGFIWYSESWTKL